MKCCRLGLLLLLMTCGVFADFYDADCSESCNENQIYDTNCKCVCKEGYYPELLTGDCLPNECNPKCENNLICVSGKCVCENGLQNNGVPGAPKCDPPMSEMFETKTIKLELNILNNTATSDDTTHNTTTTPHHTTHNTTTTPHHTTHNTTTTPHHTTHNTTTTPDHHSTRNTTTTIHPHPTHNTTTTTHKPPITTKKHHHTPGKTAMSPWAITGIIVLVAAVGGLGAYMIYKSRHRGTLRVAP
ncbi:hypothetical protein KR093_010146 [Drosophila rubida]|uniref:Uncharacterized protein n=1 Tax=Drosophila rubida TaxID=30044 RepID=A0AAD4PPL6_9MUSC|nr:hypothetical protein KR093_010146 [Drosophila rubida]